MVPGLKRKLMLILNILNGKNLILHVTLTVLHRFTTFIIISISYKCSKTFKPGQILSYNVDEYINGNLDSVGYLIRVTDYSNVVKSQCFCETCLKDVALQYKVEFVRCE